MPEQHSAARPSLAVAHSWAYARDRIALQEKQRCGLLLFGDWRLNTWRNGRLQFAWYYPPDSNCLLSVFDHCLRSRDCVNVVTCGKQAQLQWLKMDEALEHCSRGAST